MADQIQVYVIFASFCAKYEPDSMYIIDVVFVLIDIKKYLMNPKVYNVFFCQDIHHKYLQFCVLVM